MIALIIFIPLSLYLSKLKLNTIKIKKRIYFLILFSTLIFVSKNFSRIYQEHVKYDYNPIKNAFFYLNKDGFKINDTVKNFLKNKNKEDKSFFFILNKKTMLK